MAWMEEICLICGKPREECWSLAPGRLGTVNGHLRMKEITPRLAEYLAFVEAHGPAKCWKDLEALHLTEEDFRREGNKPHVGVDNSGSLSVYMLSRLMGGFNDEQEYHWGHRPLLGVPHIGFDDGPEWFQSLFRAWWDSWQHDAAIWYDMKESASVHIGPAWE